MPIDHKALLGLRNLEEMPACDEGMRLARSVLISGGEAVSGSTARIPSISGWSSTSSTTPSSATAPNARNAMRFELPKMLA
jgi:hypothetical protein